MRSLTVLAAVAVLVAAIVRPASVGAQQVAFAANVITELDSATLAAVNAEIARARAKGLPVEPLVGKVREGRHKRATGALIRFAVARLAARLDSARVALGMSSTHEELVAGADALAAGADLASLRAVRAASVKPVAAPIGTLAQLVASGVPPQRAVEMIVNLLRKNAAPAMVIALGNLVEEDVANGLRPEESARVRLRGIEGTLAGVTGADALTVNAPGAMNGVRPPAQTPPKQRRP